MLILLFMANLRSGNYFDSNFVEYEVFTRNITRTREDCYQSHVYSKSNSTSEIFKNLGPINIRWH